MKGTACGAAVLTAGLIATLGASPQSQPRDRVARLFQLLADAGRSLPRDARTGYLRPLLDALNITPDSQLLVFSKTGVQQAYTGPQTPRALYFDETVVVGYVPGAPELEIIAHDPVEGLAFYTLDQNTPNAAPTKRTSCLTCHESASTHDVPGFIVRSHTVDSAGNVLRNEPGAANVVPFNHDVTQSTSHPDRWGGWLVTLEGEAPPYAQRQHQGNITFSSQGNTSSEVFIEWMASAPEARGYLSASSDLVSLLAFDHQMPAVNLMTRLGLTWRRTAAEGVASAAAAPVRALVDELADYLLFANEAPLPVPVTPRPGFARALAAHVPHDSRGRSLAQLDGANRLLRYPCSYMVYSDAFDTLAAPVKQAVYQRIADVLSRDALDRRYAQATSDDRRAALEILRATVSDFPK